MPKPFDIKEFKPYKNYVIDASAGTGKTHNIIEIVKKLVLENICKLNEILIVTFTDKAAGELKDRIRKGLGELYTEDSSIYTIHSFCDNTIKEFGISSNLPLNLSLVSNQTITNFIKEYLRKGDILFDLYDALDGIENFNIDHLIQAFVNGISKYYLNKDNEEDEAIVNLFKVDLENRCIKYFKSISKCEKIEDLFVYIPSLKENYDVIANSKTPKCVEFKNELDRTYNKKFDFNGTNFKEKSFKDIDEKNAFIFFYNLKNDLKELAKITISYFLHKYLKDAYISYLNYKKENNYKTFDDMIRQVRESIIDDKCDLKDKLRKKYKYAIIDEFQDTNQLQFDIFSNIFLCENHNIIVVGDPKQSIYSFQGADVDVYLKAKKIIVDNGGIDCVLMKNYRSRKEQVESCNNFFKSYFDYFTNSDYCVKETDKKEYKCLYDGHEVDAFWIASEIDDNDYAKIVAREIVNCCEYDENGRTRLQITDKNDANYNYRNVTFKDFAILVRARKDSNEIIRELKALGVPFVRYKDTGLFDGKECADWIALFEAIDAIDFTGNNRNIFRKVLFTNFFGKSINEITDDLYKSDDNIEFSLLMKWREIANSNRWEDLINDIIVSSKLSDTMSTLSKLSSIGIYKQIGNYCVNYLLDNHNICDLITNLKDLQSGNEETEDENTVEKSTDFNAVKIMTMHASKGLQFPVVITKGGYKKSKDCSYNCYTYRDGNKKILSNSTNNIINNDIIEEQKRLFYVAYTRSEYITMIEIPSKESKNVSESFKVLKDLITKFAKEYSHKNLDVNEYDKKMLKEKVKIILSKNSDGVDNTSNNKQNEFIEKQEELLIELIKKGTKKKSYKHSYSSLSHSNEITEDEENKEGKQDIGLSRFDKNSIYNNPFLDDTLNQLIIPNGFPKGAIIGTCLHEIFEKIDFCNFEERIDETVDYSFKNYAIKDNMQYKEYVKNIVRNVILARMPIINGSKITENYMSLNSITFNDRKSEIEFTFNLLDEKLRNYCNGFIDLLFRRGEYYCLVDWKSDCLSDDFESFTENNSLRSHVNNSYSIQRTLYSYCLIKWLKGFYKNETEAEIFENHFGGIYYVFIRGCNKDTGNGIYCQTWNSFSDLEKSFNEIIKSKVMR